MTTHNNTSALVRATGSEVTGNPEDPTTSHGSYPTNFVLTLRQEIGTKRGVRGTWMPKNISVQGTTSYEQKAVRGRENCTIFFSPSKTKRKRAPKKRAPRALSREFRTSSHSLPKRNHADILSSHFEFAFRRHNSPIPKTQSHLLTPRQLPCKSAGVSWRGRGTSHQSSRPRSCEERGNRRISIVTTQSSGHGSHGHNCF